MTTITALRDSLDADEGWHLSGHSTLSPLQGLQTVGYTVKSGRARKPNQQDSTKAEFVETESLAQSRLQLHVFFCQSSRLAAQVATPGAVPGA